MTLQRIGIKIPLSRDLHDDARLIPVFHAWIRDRRLPEAILDVAAYRHVPESPSIMLIGFDCDFAVDREGGEPTLYVQRKQPQDGDLASRVIDVAAAAYRVAAALLAEPGLAGIDFDGRRVSVLSNDRLRAANDDAGEAVLRPAALALGERLWGSVDVQRVATHPRDRLTLLLTGSQDLRPAEALARLQG